MNIARLEVGDRSFFISSDRVDEVMASVAATRTSGEWLDLIDAGGRRRHLLIPANSLVVLERYEVSDDAEPWTGPNDWAGFDYDVYSSDENRSDRTSPP